MKKNIAIAMGGYSEEYQISLQSGKVILNYIDPELFVPYPILIREDEWCYKDQKGDEYLIDRHDFSLTLHSEKIRFDAVFNIIHGTPGEDGKLQAYWELMNIPYTSCDYYQAALTFNKRDCISVLQKFGIPTAANFFLNSGDEIDTKEIVDKVGLPCFIKANRSGSSFGVYKAKKENEIKNLISKALEVDDQVIIESFLSGKEVSVGVITYHNRIKVLPITEIVSENDFFDYEAKYEGKSQEITPARLTEEEQKQVCDLAEKVYDILGMRGMSRSEFIFHDGIPHFIEMNTIPGMSEASILPQQLSQAKISLSDFITSTIYECLEE